MSPVFSTVRAVLFDLDGTLIDSAPDLGAAVDKMRTDRGLPPLPMECYRPLAGAGARGLLGQAFGIGPDHPEFTQLREEFFNNYQACMTARTQPFEGVAQLLDHLHRKALPWGVVTNKSTRFAQPLTQQMPLFATMQTVVCGDTTAHSKPHPEPLLEACRRLGVAPQHCNYVGDDARDIEAGHAAGMGTVAACYGYLGHEHPPQTWGAHATIYSPLELLKLLKKD